MTDFPGDNQCITHHAACECREARIAELVEAAKALYVAARLLASSHTGIALQRAIEACEQYEKSAYYFEKHWPVK